MPSFSLMENLWENSSSIKLVSKQDHYIKIDFAHLL